MELTKIAANIKEFAMKFVNKCLVFISVILFVSSCASMRSNYLEKKGEGCFLENDYSKAIEYHSRAIELYPENVSAYLNRGNAWTRKEEFNRALSDYTRALKLTPQDSRLYQYRGGVFAIMGDYDRALEDFGRAMELSPDNSGLYIRRGLIWSKKGEVDKAIKDYEKAHDLDPSDPNPVRFRENLLNRETKKFSQDKAR